MGLNDNLLRHISSLHSMQDDQGWLEEDTQGMNQNHQIMSTIIENKRPIQKQIYFRPSNAFRCGDVENGAGIKVIVRGIGASFRLFKLSFTSQSSINHSFTHPPYRELCFWLLLPFIICPSFETPAP